MGKNGRGMVNNGKMPKFTINFPFILWSQAYYVVILQL